MPALVSIYSHMQPLTFIYRFFMQRKIAIAKSEEMVGAILRKDAHDDEIARKRYWT